MSKAYFPRRDENGLMALNLPVNSRTLTPSMKISDHLPTNLRSAQAWGAHAPRVLVLAPRQNTLPGKSSRSRGRDRQHARARALPRKQHAFTLLELLIVIAIIAILVGLLFPAFKAVQNQAKKTQAKNDLTQIVNAVNAFYTEYGKYPVATNDNTISNNADLFYSLRAVSAGANLNNAVNTRQIVFINPPNVKDTANPRSGIGSNGQYYDPWGTPYRIAIDGDYNNDINPNPYTANMGAGPSPLNIGVIAWSLGKDGVQGTANFNASDDVISW